MRKLKLPVIIAIVVVAAGAGLFLSGMVGGKEPPKKKHVIAPVALAEPFVVNLADTDSERFLAFNIAVQLEPMDDVHYATYSGANAGGHGGGGEPPGPAMVATYPKFYDAVMSVAATFTADELKSADGKQKLKQQLLARFAEIAETDTAEHKAGAHDPTHVSPPFHVMDVYFTKYVIQ
jgi:flagellar basal body-associated protein FliL